MQLITVTQRATNPNPEKSKLRCNHYKKLGHYRTGVAHSKKRETKMAPTTIVPVITILLAVVKQTLTPTTTKPPVMTRPKRQTTEMTENHELSTHPV